MDQMIAFMNQYWWGDVHKAAQSTYPLCSKCNPGKPVHTAPRRFELPSGPAECWQLVFIQYAPSRGYKRVLVMAGCVLSWTEAFP